MKILTIILVLLTYLPSSYAVLPFDDAAAPELVTSARALAMGNAYMSKVDDGWASFYNPAGLGTVRGLQFHLANIHLESNSGFLDVVNGTGNSLNTFGNYSDAFTPIGLRDLHAETPGKISHARFNAFPNITYRGITLGYMYSQQNRARLKSASDNFEIAERIDYGPVFSLSFSLFGGILKFGGTATYLTRKELQKDFLPTDTILINEDLDYRKGSMVHVVAGTRLTLPYAFLPTFSMVVRNTGDQDWDSPEFSGNPDKIPQTVDGGFSITPNLGRTTRMHLEIAAKDIGNEYEDVPNNRKLQYGVEFDYRRAMFVRFGFGDGWGSGGIGVRSKRFMFDLTTYAVEASADGYREEEDRRYVLSVSSGI